MIFTETIGQFYRYILFGYFHWHVPRWYRCCYTFGLEVWIHFSFCLSNVLNDSLPVNYLDWKIMMIISQKNVYRMIQYLQQLHYYQRHQPIVLFIHRKMPHYLFVNEFDLNRLKVNANIHILIHIIIMSICEPIRLLLLWLLYFIFVSHFGVISIVLVFFL